jgi:division protein CdvB (Snf7/Vps24/ESCRT-III family)
VLKTKRLTEVPDKMNKDKRKKEKKHIKYLDKKWEYFLNRSWKEWKFLITIIKQKIMSRNEYYKKRVQTTDITDYR